MRVHVSICLVGALTSFAIFSCAEPDSSPISARGGTGSGDDTASEPTGSNDDTPIPSGTTAGSTSGTPIVDAGVDADAGDGDAGDGDGGDGGALTMSFFVSSRGLGKGGDLRAAVGDVDGLAGADSLCKTLATAVSPTLGAKTWRAYLSTATVNARDRIGAGPWRNAKGVVVATSLAQLHEEGGLTNLLGAANSLDETGAPVAAGVHDTLTGSTATGMSAPNQHCNNWTSSATTDVGNIGHSDRGGNPSWNAAHATAGCAEMGANSVRSGGGRGAVYCFAL